MKRLISLFLASSVLVSAVLTASCTDKNSSDENSDSLSVTAEDTSGIDISNPYDARKLVSDNLPAETFNGREYRMLLDKYNFDDVQVECESGDILKDTVYRRNMTVEQRFDINITTVVREFNRVTPVVANAVSSGDDAFDLVSYHEMQAAKASAQGLFLDWLKMEYNDPTKDWWQSSSFDDMSINHKVCIATGSMNLYTFKATYCMYYNKPLAEQYRITDINDTVNKGLWTIDKVNSLVLNSWDDLNGDGKEDMDDFYGLSSNSTSYVNCYLYSFGEMTIYKDEDDLPYLNKDITKMSEIVEKIDKLFHHSSGVWSDTEWEQYRLFMHGKSLFHNNTFYRAFVNFRDMDMDYGIIPYPKWDEEQENYLTWSDGSASLMAIPISNIDYDFSSMITEAMNAESWKIVMPVAIETALKIKGTRDEESIVMIDMILKNVVTDIGYTYAVGMELRNAVNNAENFASYFESTRPWYESQVEELADAYLNMN